jgi:hypothetical protein
MYLIYNDIHGKEFRSDDLNQALLLPPSLHDWLSEKHLARVLVDVVDIRKRRQGSLHALPPQS